ncbi:hypothetical protein [Marinomonas epiphytica]
MRRQAIGLFVALLCLPNFSFAEQHFGAGLAYYDEDDWLYTDKAYFENFSLSLGVYTDLEKTHRVLFDAHLYHSHTTSLIGQGPVAYAGVGLLYLKNASHSGIEPWQQRGEHWGVRLPLGIEVVTHSQLAWFAEITPTYLFSGLNKFVTSTTLGARYYFY